MTISFKIIYFENNYQNYFIFILVIAYYKEYNCLQLQEGNLFINVVLNYRKNYKQNQNFNLSTFYVLNNFVNFMFKNILKVLNYYF